MAVTRGSQTPVSCAHCGRSWLKATSKVRSRNFCSRECLADGFATPGSKWSDRGPKSDEAKAYLSAYAKQNRHAANARSLEWAKQNKEKRAMSARLYAHRHREKIAADIRQRRSAGRMSIEASSALIEAAQGFCVYCGKPADRLTLDHVEPVSKSGLTVESNLIPCCRACNSSKGNRPVEEWLYRKHGVEGLGRAVVFLEQKTIMKSLLPVLGIEVEVVGKGTK